MMHPKKSSSQASESRTLSSSPPSSDRSRDSTNLQRRCSLNFKMGKRLSYGVDERPMLPLATFRKVYQGLIVYLNRSSIERKMDVAITARHRQSKTEKNGVEENSNIPILN